MTATDNAPHHGAETPRNRVIVVGAGIAGLAAALRMHEVGWDVVVIERALARRSSGYLVNLHGPGYDAAERLGVLSALIPKDIGFFTSILVHADGREKFVTPAAVAEAALVSAFVVFVDIGLSRSVAEGCTAIFAAASGWTMAPPCCRYLPANSLDTAWTAN